MRTLPIPIDCDSTVKEPRGMCHSITDFLASLGQCKFTVNGYTKIHVQCTYFSRSINSLLLVLVEFFILFLLFAVVVHIIRLYIQHARVNKRTNKQTGE